MPVAIRIAMYISVMRDECRIEKDYVKGCDMQRGILKLMKEKRREGRPEQKMVVRICLIYKV